MYNRDDRGEVILYKRDEGGDVQLYQPPANPYVVMSTSMDGDRVARTKARLASRQPNTATLRHP